VEKFVAWIVAFIISSAPPGKQTYVPDAKETKEEAEARYESIAKDIVTVVSEEEPLFRGPMGRIKTASVILSIMRHESGFRKDVDTGVGKLAKGDHGNSVCMMQLNIGKGRTFPWNTVKNRAPTYGDPPDEIVQGWNQTEVLGDRTKCIRAGYRIIKVSFGASSGLPALDWLRVYASGSTDKGSAESRSRMGLALKYFGEHKPDFKDADVLEQPVPSTIPGYRDMPMTMMVAPAEATWARKPFIRSIVTPGAY